MVVLVLFLVFGLLCGTLLLVDDREVTGVEEFFPVSRGRELEAVSCSSMFDLFFPGWTELDCFFQARLANKSKQMIVRDIYEPFIVGKRFSVSIVVDILGAPLY